MMIRVSEATMKALVATTDDLVVVMVWSRAALVRPVERGVVTAVEVVEVAEVLEVFFQLLRSILRLH